MTQSTGSVPKVERTTVHINDDTGRIAMLEKRTFGSAVDDNDTEEELIRYIYSNHLQSASLELDETGAIISYEEYHPYGTTSYQAMNVSINATAKRYRYTSKERDEESGLYYHGARYYVPWLARWTAVDPLESKYAGMSSYNYCINNPVKFIDLDGKEIKDPDHIVKDYKSQLVLNRDALQSMMDSSNIKVESGNALISFYNKILGELSKLEKSDQVYTIFLDNSIEGGIMRYDIASGEIQIRLGDNSIGVVGHELNHAYQYENREISLMTDNSALGHNCMTL